MKSRKIGTAIDNLRQALEEKFGETTGSKIIINAQHVSLYGANGAVICSEAGTQQVADALEIQSTRSKVSCS